MFLRFQIPIRLYISGRTQESLEVSTRFSHGKLSCDLQIMGEEPLHSDELPEEKRYFREGKSLVFTLSEEKSGDNLQALVEAQAYNEFVKLFRSVADRCLRSIRNFGIVPHLKELRDEKGRDDRITLVRWKTEVSHDGEEWKPLVPDSDWSMIDWFLALRGQEYAELETSNWPSTEEAIQDDLAPSPYQEFTTNAIEHLRIGNFRLALVESIIGLEIILTTYITEFLQFYKGTPLSRIKKFLNPSFGLTARLAGILDLTLHEDDKKGFDLQKVMTAVGWRNTLAHKTGHLPEGIPETEFMECILEVVKLTHILSLRAQQASASPEIKEISTFMYEKHQLSYPSIWILGNHRVLVEFTVYGLPSDFPSEDKLNTVISDLIGRLSQRDPRFEPEKHLLVRFFQLPRQLKARWIGGNLKLIQGQ